MKTINKSVVVGTLESSDVQIIISEGIDNSINIELNSSVKAQFGDSIIHTVQSVLERFNITTAHIVINDKGAIDAVIKARMEAALIRAQERPVDWSALDSSIEHPLNTNKKQGDGNA